MSQLGQTATFLAKWTMSASAPISEVGRAGERLGSAPGDRSKRVRTRPLRHAFRDIACYLLACARDYSFSIRRDLTFFSSVFCFGVVGVSDEYSLSNGLGW